MQYPHLTMIAIPNGGARNLLVARKLKTEGVLAGAPDLMLFYPSAPWHGLMIEMKTEKGRQTESQKQFEDMAEEVGYHYVVCRSLDDFAREVRAYLRKRNETYL